MSGAQVYRARTGQSLASILREAARLRTTDNVPPVTVVMPWRMGDGSYQEISLDNLATLADFVSEPPDYSETGDESA